MELGPGETSLRLTPEWSSSWMLRVVDGPNLAPGTSLVYPLRGNEIRIVRGTARATDGQVAIDDPCVSARRVRLYRSADGYTLADAGSTNVVRLNGRAVTEALLKPNDVIRLGNTLIVVDDDDPDQGGAPVSFGPRSPVALCEQLHAVESSSATRLRLDVAAIAEVFRCGIVWTSGIVESQRFSMWFGHYRRAEVLSLDALDAETPRAIAEASPNAVVVIDGLEHVSGAHANGLWHSIEQRKNADIAGSVIALIHQSHREEQSRFVRQLRDLCADFEVVIPSLANRRADILAALRREIATMTIDSVHIPTDIAEALVCHDWPDGLGELTRFAKRVFGSLTSSKTLGPEFVPRAWLEAIEVQDLQATPKIELAEFTRVFAQNRGKINKIANEFGYSRTYFYQVLERDGIDLAKVRAAYRASLKGPSDAS